MRSHPRIFARAVSPGLALLCVAALGCGRPESSPQWQRLQLGAMAPQLPVGRQLRLSVDAVLTDGSRERVTTNAEWLSSNPEVLRFEPPPALPGTLHALAEGEADLEVRAGNLSAVTHVVVGARALDAIALQFDERGAALAKGEHVQVTALGTWSTGEVEDVTADANWRSSDEQVLALDSAPGAVIAGSEGSSDLCAVLNGVGATATVQVGPARIERLEIDPPQATLALGTQATLTVTAIYTDQTIEDATSDAVWTSNDPEIAEVNENQLRANAIGQTGLSATVGEVSAAIDVTVTAAVLTKLNLTPSVMTLPVGSSTRFQATGTFTDGTTQDLTDQAQWTSSDPAVLSTMTAALPGTVVATEPGEVALHAKLDGIEGSAQVTVSAAQMISLEILPGTPVVKKTTSLQLQAMARMTDSSSFDVAALAAWMSSDPSIATVDGVGRITGVSEGSVTITATYQAQHPSVTVTVSAAPLVSLEVTAAAASLPKGYSQPLQAMGVFADGHQEDVSPSVLWTSSDPLIAAVSNAAVSRGTVTAVGQGTATIYASLAGITGGFSLTASPAVLDHLELTAASATSIPRGLSAQLTATGVFSDGSRTDLSRVVSWSSTDTSVAPVDARGAVNGLQEGTATITATHLNQSESIPVTVTPAVVVSLNLLPSYVSAAPGTVTPLQALALWSDGLQQDVTSLCTWASVDPTVATVSMQSGTEGQVTTVAPGATTITAAWSGYQAMVRVEVTAP